MKGNKHIVKGKFILFAFIFFLVFSSDLFSQTVIINDRTYKMIDGKWYQIEEDHDYLVDTRVITVKYGERIPLEEILEFEEEQRVTEIRSNILGFVDLEIPEDSDPIEVIQDFINSGLFEIAELNTIGEYVIIPNDPLFTDQWSLNNTGQTGGTTDADIDAPEAWDIEKGNSSIIIGILDSGTDWTHVDLGPGTGNNNYQNIWLNPGEDAWINPNDPTTGNHLDDDGNGYIDDWKGWDFHNNNNDSRGPNYHGTHVAGISAAKTNNSIGIAGIAGGWGAQGSLLLIAGVGDNTPNGSILDDAILYAAQEGVKIITMSVYPLGNPLQLTLL